MPAFIHVNCSCGREVRVRKEQAGSRVRCWSCGREVEVPPPRTTGPLAGACALALRDALRPSVIAPVFLSTFVVVAALNVPVVSAWLVFALLAAAAWLYQALVAAAGASIRRSLTGKEPRPDDGETRAAGVGRFLSRAVLSVVAAAALVAPFVARNGGHLLPGEGTYPGAGVLAVAALAGWVVVPLVLFAANATDYRGPVRPRAAVRALVRHPLAAALAVAIFPLGLVLVEGVVASISAEEGYLGAMVSDLFPTPRLTMEPTGVMIHYDYGGFRLKARFSTEFSHAPRIYLAGLRRGYTLVWSIPASLPAGPQVRFDTNYFQTSFEAYTVARSAVSTVILTGVALLLMVQARWLGLIGAVDTAFLPVHPAAEPSRTEPGTNGPVASAAPGVMPPAAPAIPPPSVHAGAGAAASPPASVPNPYVPGFGPPIPVSVPSAGPAGYVPAPLAGPVPPMAHGPAPAPVGLGVSPFPQGAPAGTQTILIIDDERAFSHALSRILVGRGFAVHIAGDAAEGLRLALSARPDVIVLDLLLPDRPGMDLCRDLRANPLTRTIPVVVASYKAGADDEVAALTQGADDFLAKPYVVEVLITRIQTQLRRKRV